ncbi:MAG: hypothetical protein ACLPYO_10365, partial [Mycobacterium sp.]
MVFEFCSSLVDLVICVRRHGGGGHGLALAGERFVGRVAEDVAEVGDRGAEFGDPRRRERAEREPGDGGRRFVAFEPVEKNGEDGQRDVDRRGVARIVEVADRPLSQFDQGYANNGPVTANKRSDISAQNIRSQIARAK